MGWDGSGSFTLDYDWTDDYAAGGLEIEAAKMDTQQETIRAGVEACGHLDGQNANYGVDTGSAGVITVSINSGKITSYKTGLELMIKVAATNTGTALTINLNTIGAKSVRLNNQDSVYAGSVKADGIYVFRYDGTYFRLLNPSAIDEYQNDSLSSQTITSTYGNTLTLTADSVVIGDTFTISMHISGTKGGTAGLIRLKNTENGSYTFAYNVAGVSGDHIHSVYIPASASVSHQVTFHGRVSTSGTFGIDVTFLSEGSDITSGTVSASVLIKRA